MVARLRSGCSLLIYELKSRRVVTSYASCVHLVHADALLLTADVGYVVAVDTGGTCLAVWRIKNLRAVDAYQKYVTDDFPADDRKLPDTHYFYDDSADGDEQQVFITIIFIFLFSKPTSTKPQAGKLG